MPLALPVLRPTDAPATDTLPQFRLQVRYAGFTYLTVGTVLSCRTQRGRSNASDTTVPGGSATLTVDDTAGVLDPDNTSSPLHGYLDTDVTGVSAYIDVWIPSLLTWQSVFSGRFQNISRSWPGGQAYSETSVTLADGTPDLSDHVLPAGTFFQAQTPGARVIAMTQAVSRSGYLWQTRSISGRVGVDPGSKVLGPLFTDGTTTTWSYLSAAAFAERGLVFFGADSTLLFHGFERRLRAGAGSSAVTFGDSAGEVKYQSDLSYVLTRNQITRDIGVATVDATTSVYGQNGLTAVKTATTGISLASGSVAQLATVETSALADQHQGASLARYSWRRFRNSRRLLQPVTVNALADYSNSSYGSSTAYHAATTLDLSDVVTVTRRPQGGGSTLTGKFFIESVAHDFASDHWTTSYVVSPVLDTATAWQLGTSRLGTSSTSPARLSW